MSKRKNYFIDDLFDFIEKSSLLYFLYLVYLYFSNRTKFWKYLILYIAILAVIIGGIIFWEKRKRAKRFKAGKSWYSEREMLRWLRSMKPAEFEEYIADLFIKLGHKAEAVGASHDGGIDVITEKDGIKHYIQCKKYITSVVGVNEVRDFYGAVVDHLARGNAYFITTNKFTLEAEKFAEDKPIELIDGFRLIDYIKLAEKNNNIGNFVNASRDNERKCPQCGGNLIKRKGRYGEFYGCSNYPKCKFTRKIENI